MRKGFLQRAASALARRTVGGYPHAWRERYEVEVLTLLEDSPARWRDVIDLARGLVVERARSTFEPGDRPVLSASLVSLEGLARAGGLMTAPVLAGLAAHFWFGTALPAAERLAILLYAAALVAFVIGLSRNHSPTAAPFEPRQPIFARRFGYVWVALLLSVGFVLSWAPSWSSAIQVLNLTVCLAHQISRPRPWKVEMARALHYLRTAQNQMKWAHLELQRCEDLVAEGSPAPLQTAREVIERLNRQQEEALATLHSLGYRATLRTAGTSNLELPNPEPNQNTN